MSRRTFRISLIAALFGAIVTLIGDLLLGANPTTEVSTGTVFLDMFADAFDNSDLRMVMGGLLGTVGIPITGIGYIALSKLFKRKNRAVYTVYRVAAFAFIAFAGAGVHLSCSAVPVLYKWAAS